MKYVCLGFMDEGKWASMAAAECEAMMKECFAYDEILKRDGHFISDTALQSSGNAVTLRWYQSKVSVTDGPFAETKEQLGGILILEARDLNQAIQLMSNHPGVRLGGPFEIRPMHEEITTRAMEGLDANELLASIK